MHAREMPCWTRSRAAAAAAAMVGKDETATVEGRRGASLSVAACAGGGVTRVSSAR